MSLDQRIQELEKESHRWMFSNPERYRQVTTEMMALSVGAGPEVRARAYRAHSNALRMEGRWEEALRAARRALRLWRRAGHEVEWARTQTTLIPILAQLGQIRQAIAASRAGLAVFLRYDQALPAARLLNNTGGIYLYTGRPREALNCYEQAKGLALKAADPVLGARTDVHWAMALQALGRHREALRRCAMALRPAARSRQALHVASILVVAANSLFQLGRFGNALRRFAKARTLFEQESATREVAECDLHICACYLELNRYAPALGRIESFLAEPGRAWFETAWAWYYRGVALARLGHFDESRSSLGKAGRLFRRHRDRQGAARAGLEEAELLLRLGIASRAAALASRLQRDGRLTSSLEKIRASLVIAAASLENGRLKRAEHEAQQALVLARRAQVPGLIFQALHLLGQVDLRRGQFDTAHRYLTKAVYLAEQMRTTVQLPFRRTFLADKAAAYADLIWLYLKQGDVKEAYRLVGKAKSRALADQLVAAPTARPLGLGTPQDPLQRELEAIRREYQQLTLPTQLGTMAGAETRTLPEVDSARRRWLEHRLGVLWDELELRRVGAVASQYRMVKGRKPRLRHGEALVEYFVARNRVFAFVSDRNGLCGWSDLGGVEPVVRSLELLQLNLEATLNLRRSGRLAGLTKNANSHLQELYRRLWAPLPGLSAKGRMLIVPHGPLHQVPFAALYDGERYLVERVELTLAPSRTVWQQCTEKARRQPVTGDLVLGYNPIAQLPFVETEAVTVARALAAPVYLGEQARLDQITKLGPCRVLHLAVHGQFRPDNPEFSALQLADGALTAVDVTNLQLQAALVTLSACETGLSRVTNGDELTGLITAFLMAGSTAVLASLWRVDDEATADLMVRFYERLLDGNGKAAALRGAQIDMINKQPHPLFWAGFAIIGDGGPILAPLA
jgi:tetratricopeptide (TPR) repeat protein